MGSEMCIRDRWEDNKHIPILGYQAHLGNLGSATRSLAPSINNAIGFHTGWTQYCLLYTSDAADERSSVDLGGRRIIKKKRKADRHDDGWLNGERTANLESHIRLDLSRE